MRAIGQAQLQFASLVARITLCVYNSRLTFTHSLALTHQQLTDLSLSFSLFLIQWANETNQLTIFNFFSRSKFVSKSVGCCVCALTCSKNARLAERRTIVQLSFSLFDLCCARSCRCFYCSRSSSLLSHCVTRASSCAACCVCNACSCCC